MKKDLPRLCHVGWHGCIRQAKESVALKKRGYEVNQLLHRNLPSHYSIHYFDSVTVYTLGDGVTIPSKSKHFDHFKRAIEALAPRIDIFHAHNEPSWFPQVIKQVTDKPVVYDLHDLASERDFVVRPDEDAAWKASDALIAQGAGYEAICAEKRPDLAKQGLITSILSTVPREWWPKLNRPMIMHGGEKMGGVVYEGGLSTQREGGAEFRYRYWVPFFKEMIDLNVPVSIQPSSTGNMDIYKQVGCRVCSMVPYWKLLQDLTIYDWGMVGNAVNHPAFDNAMPNKLFEYIAAGLPVFVKDSKMAAEFVKDEGIGVVVDSAKDVFASYPKAYKYIPNVLKARKKYVMDREVEKLDSIYDKLANRSTVVNAAPKFLTLREQHTKKEELSA